MVSNQRVTGSIPVRLKFNPYQGHHKADALFAFPKLKRLSKPQTKGNFPIFLRFFRQTLDKPRQTLFNTRVADALAHCGGADLYKTVAYDKGKPVVRQGRKAVSLFGCLNLSMDGEIVWLPKAI